MCSFSGTVLQEAISKQLEEDNAIFAQLFELFEEVLASIFSPPPLFCNQIA